MEPRAENNVATRILSAGRAHGSRPAIRVRGENDRRDVAHEALEREVRRFATLLEERGVAEEQRVLITLPDGPELVVAFLGAIWRGAVPVLVNPFLRPPDYRFFVDDSRARLWIAPPSVHADGGAEPARLEVEPGGGGSLRDALAACEPSPAPFPSHAEDAAFWLYSSGTTGRPKGTIHLQRNVVAALEGYGASILETRAGDVCYATSKLFFAYGLGASLYFPLAAGASVVLVPDAFRPAHTWRVLAEERPTLFFSVPSAYHALLAERPADARAATASIRSCLSAGEGLPPGVFAAWRDATGHEILDGIGSTELLHIYLTNRPGDVEPGTLGTVVPGYEVAIVDEQGRALPEGEPGTMRVRGGSLAAGYWHRREATQRAFHGEWYDSGDRAVAEPGGRYRILGRADDMLKVSGQWVAPGDVESVIAAVPGVRECAIVGQSGPDGLTDLVVCVSAAEGDRAAVAAAIEERAAASLPRYKRPKSIHWVDAFPRTATGKLQRFKLREEVARSAVKA